jgi:hypothetical protein
VSISDKLATQDLAREDSRACTNPGTAIANNIPMINTAIMTSTNVKPTPLSNLAFIDRISLYIPEANMLWR